MTIAVLLRARAAGTGIGGTSMQVRLIQVGLGGWGFDWAKNVLPAVRSIEAVAFVDADPAARKRLQERLGVSQANVFATLDAALAAVAADGVLVVLPTSAHKPVAEGGLKAGLPVIVEKPFTSTLGEARDLIALADEVGRILMVSQNYRYHSAVSAAADLVQSRAYGRPLSATIEFRQDWKATGHRYHDIPGPLLLDMGIHHFDMVRMIFAENVESVACRSWNTPYSPFREDAAAHALLRLESGIMVSYLGSWLRRGVPTAWSGDWTIECEEGELIFSARKGDLDLADVDRLLLRTPKGAVEELPLPRQQHSDRAGALDAFAQAILSQRTPRFFPSAEDNIHSLATSFACMQSSRSDGRWLAVADAK
jgi:predicted dehydrogenase